MFDKNVPLESFVVQEGNKYLFRMICSSGMFGFRVSVDNHMLTAVAMDGHDIEAYETHYITIFPGERFDFYITADQPAGQYWFRMETLEFWEIRDLGARDAPFKRVEPHLAVAILDYGVDSNTLWPRTHPTTQDWECTTEEPCTVLNCAFG